jgi:hypothetical protein
VSEPSNDARLEKIQGGVDLINERLKAQNELQNERHTGVLASIKALHDADAALDGRVGALETESSERVGQLKGLALSGRILWTIIGAVPVGIGALALKLLGA